MYVLIIQNMKYLLGLLFISAALGLVPREPAPHFEAVAVLPDLSFSQVKLTDYKDKYLVLLFYPFDFTYVCPT